MDKRLGVDNCLTMIAEDRDEQECERVNMTWVENLPLVEVYKAKYLLQFAGSPYRDYLTSDAALQYVNLTLCAYQ